MPFSKYRLTYFPIKGRGELIRLIFRAARVPFEDRRVPFELWPEFKPKTPTGSLPVLEIDGMKFTESAAIANWAARKYGLMGKTDADELRTEALLIQATEFREKFIAPFFTEKDPGTIEKLKTNLETGIGKVFSKWEAKVVQTESTGRKIFSYMVTQSLTAADLAILYVADLAQEYVQVDWARFPRLKAVINTVSEVPHIKAYLTNQDDGEMTSRSRNASQLETSRNEAALHGYSKGLVSPRGHVTGGHSPKMKAAGMSKSPRQVVKQKV